MTEHIEIGQKLHAKFSDGAFYPAEVVTISQSQRRAKKPVKVTYLGYGPECDVWLPVDSLKSKRLQPKSQPEVKVEQKATWKTKAETNGDVRRPSKDGDVRRPSKEKIKEKTKVAIFGGAFDPPTMNHLLAAAEVIHTGMASQVWLVPCGPRPDKPNLSTCLDRLTMSQIGVNTFFSPKTQIYVSDYEALQKEALTTYDSLSGLRTKYPDKEFSFIIGTDWLQPGTNIRQWKSKDPSTGEMVVSGEKLVSEFEFLVVHRPGYDVEDISAFGPRMTALRMPEGTQLMSGNLSSTEIRKRSEVSTRANDSLDLIEGLVAPAVFNYINQKKLYRGMESLPSSPSSSKRRTLSANSGFGSGKRIAVFGGAFDPPSNSHMLALAEIIHSGSVDEAMLIPCGPRVDKPNLKPPLLRYTMCQLAVSTTFSHKFPVKVSDLEVFEKESLATYDALCALRSQEPGARIFFVIGSDWLQPGSDLRGWKSKCPETGELIVTGDRLVSEFDFIVLKRPGYEVEDLSSFGERMHWMEMPDGMRGLEANLSSTEVRRRASHSRNDELRLIDGLVPQGVYNFITRQRLYRK